MSDPTIHIFRTYQSRSVNNTSSSPSKVPHPHPPAENTDYAESHHIVSERQEKQETPRPDLAYLGIASYGLLSETHSLLGFAVVEKLSPLLGALANLAGMAAGGLKILLSSFSAACMAHAHLRAERQMEEARWSIEKIDQELAALEKGNLQDTITIATYHPDAQPVSITRQDYKNELLRHRQEAIERYNKALHQSDVTHVNFAMDTTKTIAGVLFAGSSILRLGSDLVALGFNLPAASTASAAGAILGKLSIGLTLVISLNNLTRLGFDLDEDRKSLEKIESQRRDVHKNTDPLLRQSTVFKSLERRHLDFQEKKTRAKLRLDLISLAVNTAALIGGIAILAMSLAKVPGRRGALGFLSVVAIGFAVVGTFYSIQQKRKLTGQLAIADPKGKHSDELQKFIDALNKQDDTAKAKTLDWLSRYLEIPTSQQENFKTNYSGFLQARYGQTPAH